MARPLPLFSVIDESMFQWTLTMRTMMLNHYLFVMIRRQRDAQTIAEVKAARAWQLGWQRKISRTFRIVTSFIKDREITISNQAQIVHERNHA